MARVVLSTEAPGYGAPFRLLLLARALASLGHACRLEVPDPAAVEPVLAGYAFPLAAAGSRQDAEALVLLDAPTIQGAGRPTVRLSRDGASPERATLVYRTGIAPLAPSADAPLHALLRPGAPPPPRFAAHLDGAAPDLPLLLAALVASGLPGDLHVTGGAEIDGLPDRIRFSPLLQPLQHLLARASVVVHHGARGLGEAALFAGRPQLVLPGAPGREAAVARFAAAGVPIVDPASLPEALGGARQRDAAARTAAEALWARCGEDAAGRIALALHALLPGRTRLAPTPGREAPSPQRLTALALVERPPSLRPAPTTRAWMDATPGAFAYRCLPLAIANAHGWEVLCPSAVEAVWDGSPGVAGIRITGEGGGDAGLASSHFGSGVLTFSLGLLFRTDPGVNLWVGGPVNAPKDGIQALTGIVETDWSPATFTMNWRFTRPDHPVRFARDEPICMVFPLPRGALPPIEPELVDLYADPKAAADYTLWRNRRAQFLADLAVPGSQARTEEWEKTYFQGRLSDRAPGPADHETKLRLKPFADRRQH